MFLLVPTSTDAPIYHWPFATGGLMLLNIVVLILQFMFPGAAENWELHFGTINPLTWVTAMCMHYGVVHLISNLIGLALFGWIVEGKIGWWQFLIVYFLIGISGNALAQIIMLFFGSGNAAGASGAIYGLIAIALIWAPENEIKIFYFMLLFMYPIMGTFDVTVMAICFLMIGGEFLSAAFTGFGMSSAVLHLLGAIPGGLIGYLMIRWRLVDCDGFDLVSTMRGKRGERVMTIADEKAMLERNAQARADAKLEREEALMKVDQYVQAGHYEMALKRFEMLRRGDQTLVLTEPQLIKIITAFDADPAKKLQTIPLLKTYLGNYEQHAVHFTLMLARAYIVSSERPRLGLKVLQNLRGRELNVEQTDFARRLGIKAKRMIDDGILEVDD